jgi:anti-sigma regulatory factor (Ser/Thr protein kinase)
VAALLVDELFVNSIRHSGSAAPGETVTVAVKTADDVIRVEVTDLRGQGVPQLRPSGDEAEDGRGFISSPAWPRGGGGGGAAVVW